MMPSPDLRDLYRQIGELVAETREAAKARERLSEKLEDVSDQLHSMNIKLTPLLDDVQSHGSRLAEIDKERQENKVGAAKRAGLVAGYGLAAGTGGAFLQRVLEWIGNIR